VSCFSKVPWSEVHNAGGTAGRGASEPKREFLAILDEDRAVLADIVLSHLRGESR
jgi:phage gpG-like protein